MKNKNQKNKTVRTNSTPETWEKISECDSSAGDAVLAMSNKGRVRYTNNGKLVSKIVPVGESIQLYRRYIIDTEGQGFDNFSNTVQYFSLVSEWNRLAQRSTESYFKNVPTAPEPETEWLLVYEVGHGDNAERLIIDKKDNLHFQKGKEESQDIRPVSLLESFAIASEWLFTNDKAAELGASIDVTYHEAGLAKWYAMVGKAFAQK